MLYIDMRQALFEILWQSFDSDYLVWRLKIVISAILHLLRSLNWD